MKKIIDIAVRDVYDEIDKMLETSDAICKEGCSYCCNQPIEILDPEIPIIKEGIDKLTPEQKERVKQRCYEWWEYFNKNTPKPPLTVPAIYGDFTHKNHKDHLPCPLLEDNRCMIYEHRPHPCRLHFQECDIEKCKKNKIRDGVINGVYFVDIFMTYLFEITDRLEGLHFQRAVMEILDPSYKFKKMDKMIITREHVKVMKERSNK